MAQEAVNNWLEKTLDTALNMIRNINAEKLDDSFGWGAILFQQLEQSQSISGRGLLLTGPDGCGKHTAAAYMIKFLSDRQFECVFLDGCELSEDGIETATMRLDALLEYSYDQGRGMCIALEHMEQCRYRWELLSYLGSTLYDYWLNQDQVPPVFLILLDNQEQGVPTILRKRLRLCRMVLPSLSRRKIFIENCARDLRKYISLDSFADATAGATYAQMLDLIQNVRDLLDSRDAGLSEEDFLSFVREQMPIPDFRDILTKAVYSASSFFEKMPQILHDTLASTQTDVAAISNSIQFVSENLPPSSSVTSGNTSQGLAKNKTEIENMSVNQLAVELFGQKFVTELLNTRS